MLEKEILSTFNISALVVLERKAELSVEERQYLETWLSKSDENRKLYKHLQDEKLTNLEYQFLKSFDSVSALDIVNARINNDTVPLKRRTNYKFYYYAAAAISAVLIGVFLFTKTGNKEEMLSDQQIVASDLKTITTPKGKNQQIVLPDGTKVWLSAASSLSYSRTFDRSDYRIVLLNGEAYFDVLPSKDHPFIVKTKFQEIEVLGTRFLVEGYAEDSEVKTSLFSGKVKIKRDNAKDVVLSPGQQSLVTSFAVRINQMSDSSEAYTPEDQEYINFKGETIQQVMVKVSRWYDIQVKYDGTIGTSKISGSISTETTLPKVIEMLSILFPKESIKLKGSVVVIKHQK